MNNVTHNPWKETVTDNEVHELDFTNQFAPSASKMEVIMRMRSGANLKFSIGKAPGDNSPEYDATNFKEDFFTIRNDTLRLYYQSTSATGQEFTLSF